MSVDGINQLQDQAKSNISEDPSLHLLETKAEDRNQSSSKNPSQSNMSTKVSADSGIEADKKGAVTHRLGMAYSWQAWRTGVPLLLTDLIGLAIVITAIRTLFQSLGYPVGMDLSQCMLPIATGFILINAELGLYPGIRLSPVEEFRRLAVAVTVTFSMWSVGVILQLGSVAVQSWFLLVAYVFCLAFLPIIRGWARCFLAKMSWWGFPTLVCGDDSVAVNLHNWLKTNRRLGLHPVGVIADPNGIEIDENAEWYAGSWKDAERVSAETGAYWAVIVPPEQGGELLSDSISNHLSTVPHLHVVSELTGLPDHWNRHQKADGLSGIHLQQNLLLPGPRMTKRAIDLIVSIVGGILISPMLIALAVGIKFSSKGPVFYGHERIGRNGKRFRAWKFRSMVMNADQVLEDYLNEHPELRAEWEKDHKLKSDPRITAIGRLVRKASLDELPQLWNVIRGEMSLVGPRPIVTDEIEKYGKHFEQYTFVLPGITGLWQVSGRNDTSYEDRVKLDTYYVRNWSPWMDVYLLMKTVKIVLFADGAY